MIDTVLLDTDDISYLLKGDNRIEAYGAHLQDRQLAISLMTVAELFQWAAIRNWGLERIHQLEETLSKDYLVLPFDIKTCRLWGFIRAKRRALGRPVSPQDAWVAATALQHNIPLVTHNLTDYIDIDNLKVITAQ